MKTKTSILLVALMMGLCSSVNSQNLRIGILAGPSFSTVSETGNLYDNDDIRTGISTGIQVNYALHGNWSLRSGLVFEEKGFREKRGSEVVNGDFDYFTVPLMLRGSLPINEKMKLFGMAGPYYSYLVKQEIKGGTAGTEGSGSQVISEIDKQDAGWTAGAGVGFQLMDHPSEFFFRYSQGLVKLNDENKDNRNKSLSLSLCFFF
jgi:opacity protein-like surface antigen